MLRYLLTRALYMLPVVWLVVSVVFLMIHLVPGDPIQQMLGEGAAATDLAAARHAYGLDVPLGQQYVNYWRGILHGDMGRSLRLNQNVGHVIAQAYPATMELTLAALIVALGLSIPAGVRSALRRNRWDDRLLSFVSLLGLSFPNFALGRFLFCFSRSNWDGCRCRARVRWLISCFRQSPWEERWRRSLLAWFARRCWKNWGRITFGLLGRKACPSERWFTGTRCTTR